MFIDMRRIYESLTEYADSGRLPMHMPGHKRRLGALGNPYFIDITEIDGFDNLHHARGLLLEAEQRAQALYGAEETHYLVNGSTAGILAAVSGCTAYGGTLLMARNSHKSVYHGAMLRGLKTVYLYPEELSGGWGLNGQVRPETVERALDEYPGIQAVTITSPTYDGVVSDVEAIARLVHERGLPLIVDEAHGAHFPFSAHFPKNSNRCGADVVIHSLHKTLPALTQTALLHINGPLADRERIRGFLSVYQTSSPSYVLMASIDEALRWVGENGPEFERFWRELREFRGELKKLQRLRLIEAEGMDESKILISTAGAGISGNELAGRLRREYGIETEMACCSYICAITSVADGKKEFRRFLDALQELDRKLPTERTAYQKETVLPAQPVYTISRAEEMEKVSCPLGESVGRVSGAFVIPYPPGIPVLAPGERITEEIAERLFECSAKGLEVYGLEGNSLRILEE